jgi:chaperone modulatory protein CbpM
MISKEQFLSASGVQVQTLEFWLEQEWLIPQQVDTEMRFSDGDVARARLIQNLKADFGVNDQGVDVVLHLVDQLHGMRRAFAQLHKDVSELQSRRS